ncbi:glutamate synthase large subunit [Demequina zhanjiangensis]|uniref:Glutamate synthase large subunit n=1 Tax=Demequina zhanjiangensis TaxID=3051659 RepID=A0ABT8G1X3_9MICO|nr:glutamate synthase large subunit [Demequina sp. SYSU T00b26]MDN4473144.1 glutamate synthase large subunit [Demequina sp. SYSU T00b26]
MASLLSAPQPSGGLYNPAYEHDACGVAFVATLRGTAGRDIVDAGLTALKNLEHRGAVGAETETGDGAGILTQVPDAFLREVTSFDLPEAGAYGVGIAFLTPGEEDAETRIFEDAAAAEGVTVLGWRDVPVELGSLGPSAQASAPTFRQAFLACDGLAGVELDRRLYRVRRRSEHADGPFFASLSARTLTYKGMLTTYQLEKVFPDLLHPAFASELALVHSRFSTNTFPSWPLAQPLRLIAHNGEINTVQGNRNWMAAKEGMLRSELLGEMADIAPICTPGASDTASFDEVLELLHLGGRSLPHAVLMMIPEAWQNNPHMDPARRAFYEYHSTLMEPWDGPAALHFTDGTLIGATLDRNGLRPGRFWVTDDGLVVCGSEAGLLDIDPAKVIRKGRLQPGRMLLVDTAGGRIVEDEEIKAQLASEHPYSEWIDTFAIRLSEVPDREHISHSARSVMRRQRAFGYTEEELKILLTPMAKNGIEPIGAMGSDTPIAVLSKRPRLLFDYFVQMFAQVTNPPLDSIREEIVTSIGGAIGPEPNLLEALPEHARKVMLDFPVIDNDELAKIAHIDADPRLRGIFSARKIRGLYRVAEGGEGLEARLKEIFEEVDQALADGVSFLILSDRDANKDLAPIPSLLLTAAVHHHLVRHHTRTQMSMVVEAGDVREVHHVALLIGYGAGAVNPYLAMETVEDLAQRGYLGDVSAEKAVKNLIKALGKGVLKIMSKMGISTIASYRGAQVFEAIGLSRSLVDRHFVGTPSQIDGVGLDVIAQEVAQRHADAYPASGELPPHQRLNTGGEYQWRRDGEEHLFDPETVFKLQHSTRTRRFDLFREYTDRVDDQAKRLMTLRGLLEFSSDRPSIPIDEVEPVSDIVARFSTGAMSYGSISKEAHETLAIAMNRLGAKSNTGEGGESPERLLDPERRSAIKQVASGRFGVTSEYLVNSDDIQIKLAQGAKPGEGGQLPGAKVYPWVAETRHSTPGVGLISPPPHHDIYSIEDLKQLIHDLKNANPTARIHTKLVSEVGVGTIAAGVAKCKSDVVLISGHDGGTGASPLNSLKHAGAPWEVGLADTQQTLVLNDLRDRIVVQVDGQLKTGRDVIVAALLGAEEFGFATAPLVVSGCVMMRVCHMDTCPVGVATQNPELRERFTGKPEFVETFFEFIAEQVRELLAELGFRSLAEAVGHVEVLETKAAVEHWKAKGLDLSPVLARPAEGAALLNATSQEHGLEDALDQQLIAAAAPALDRGEPVSFAIPIRNVNRTVGTMLGYELTRSHGGAGLPDDTIDITFTGSAGQSFAAFVPKGITMRLVGDANDYVAKGLSGGRVIVRPAREAMLDDSRDVIAGNVIGYGGTSGEILLRGVVGERFLVRNSGLTAVVEGVGDHALEYMTGGTAVILGRTGRNLGAGMSGGTAYVLDLRTERVNKEALAGGELTLSPLDAEDETIVRTLIERHVAETESPFGKELLADWTATATRFTRVLPAQYARVREALAEIEAKGGDLTAPGAWADFLEVTGG